MTGHENIFDESNYKSVLIKIKSLLKYFDKILDKVSNIIKKGFDCKQVHNEKYLRNKTKSYESKINTSFHNNGMHIEGSHCICLLVILINSIFKIGKNNYLKLVLELKYTVKEKKIGKYTDDEFGISSNDSDVEVFDQEVSDV